MAVAPRTPRDAGSANCADEVHLAHSTVRSYQLAVGAFCDFVCDPAYGWTPSCLDQFSSAPSADLPGRERGRPRHRVRRTARSALADRVELQALFDAADDDVESIRARSQEGLGPGVPRCHHAQGRLCLGPPTTRAPHARASDFSPNPKAPEFGDYGVCNVRWGKAAKGGPPRRRGVLTVFGWSNEVLSEWIDDVWPTMETAGVGPVALRTRAVRERGPHQRRLSPIGPGRRPARRAHAALLAPQLCDPPDRRRLRRPLRPTASRPRVRLDPGHLHLGVVGLRTRTLRAALDGAVEAAALRRGAR